MSLYSSTMAQINRFVKEGIKQQQRAQINRFVRERIKQQERVLSKDGNKEERRNLLYI